MPIIDGLTKVIDQVRFAPWRPVQPGTFGGLVHARIQEQDVQLILLEVVKSSLGKRLDSSQVCKVQRQD